MTDLGRRGYTASSTKKHFYLLVKLSRWLDEHVFDVGAVATVEVEPFFAARWALPTYGHARRCDPWSRTCRHLGVVAATEVSSPTSDADRVVSRFRTYLHHERGLVEGTVRFYARVAGLLVAERTSAFDADLAGLRAQDVTAFTTRGCADRSLSSCRQTVSVLGRSSAAVERRAG